MMLSNQHDEFEALKVLLQTKLPEDVQKWWYTSAEIETVLKTSGLVALPKGFVTNAFRSNNNDASLQCGKNKYCNKRWFCFDVENAFYKTPKDQKRNDRQLVAPVVLPNNLKDTDVGVLEKYRSSTHDTSSNMEESDSNESTNKNATSNQLTSTTTAGDISLPDDTEMNENDSKQPTGLMIADIDTIDAFNDVLQDHAISCRHKLTKIESTKRGFELFHLDQSAS